MGSILVFGDGGPALADPSSLTDPQSATIAALTARLAAAEAAIVALKGQVAVLQGRSIAVALAGALPVATVQIGSLDMPVPVAGLLRTDTVAYEIEGDMPAGLDIRGAHPARDRDGVLLVQLVALSAGAIPAPVPLRLTVFRAL